MTSTYNFQVKKKDNPKVPKEIFEAFAGEMEAHRKKILLLLVLKHKGLIKWALANIFLTIWFVKEEKTIVSFSYPLMNKLGKLIGKFDTSPLDEFQEHIKEHIDKH